MGSLMSRLAIAQSLGVVEAEGILRWLHPMWSIRREYISPHLPALSLLHLWLYWGLSLSWFFSFAAVILMFFNVFPYRILFWICLLYCTALLVVG